MRKPARKITRNSRPVVELLENRELLSVATQTTLGASTNASVFGQDVTYTATVSVPGSSTTPTGIVKFLDGTTLLGTANVDANGEATFDVYNLFRGAHSITAKYTGNSTLGKSVSSAEALTITKQTFNTTADGLQKANTGTATSTSGAADGDSLQVEYTGYLSDGTKFDSSLNSGRTPFTFTLTDFTDPADEQPVIVGWDEGLAGLKPGRIRTLIIPSALGYGASGSGSIPGNAKLFFIVQLLSFQSPTTPKIVISGTNSQPITSKQAASDEDGTDFGAQSVGTTSAAATFSLTPANTGANLQATQNPFDVLAGADPSDFIFGSYDSSTGTITVEFDPQTTGTFTAKVKLFTNDAADPTFVINLTGTGV
ncbi:MAG TPA: FKBP-type peptidyl-prolyl cis-trans isomerase [Tepidisphaeraceae bacterium]|nr:FKBP-type peptidyl-prolyl cis-trans isomerase [Tepidisphaeraceae bacterium]